MKKVLITGGAGFIGSHLVDALIEKGYVVSVLDNLSSGLRSNVNKNAKFYKGDVCDKKIDKIFSKERPDAVFHYAAQISVRDSLKNPVEDARMNILGSLNVLESCRKHKVKKIIFSSSGGSIYGQAESFPTNEDSKENPLSPYAVAKLSVEKYLNYYFKVHGVQYVALRFANVYGPRQNSRGEAGVVAIFSDKMIANKKITINGSGRQTRDFVFVADIVSASVLALEKSKNGIFNLGTGKETSVNQIFSILKKELEYGNKKSHVAAQGGELKRSCLDFSKIKKVYGWVPKYDLEAGLKNTAAWFKAASA